MNRRAVARLLCLVMLTSQLPGCGALNPFSSRGVASGEAAGVRVQIERGAWKATPANLEEYFLPLYVTIENGSAHPLRIRLSDLVLRGPVLDLPALPPPKLVMRDVELQDGEAVLIPQFEHSGFRVADHSWPSFSELRPGGDAMSGNGPWFERGYVRWTGALPTLEMIEAAIPDGVIEPNGRLSGFLYFEKPKQRTRELRFEVDLVDANTELSFGTVRIGLP